MSHDPHADPDFLRRQPAHIHYWCATDEYEDVYVCRYCGETWSLDDDPDDGGRAA